jgi:hypothetical protein
MPSKKILVRLDATTAAAVEQAAVKANVTPSTWCYHAVKSVATGEPFAPEVRPVGMAAMDDDTVRRVTSMGGRVGGKVRAKRRKRRSLDTPPPAAQDT